MGPPIDLPSPCLVVLVGIAGSGKSTWARANFEPSQIVSSDALRALVGEGEGDQAASKDAFAILDDVVQRRLARGLTTVVDTLGLDEARRASYRAMAARQGIPCIAVALEVEPARIRRQNRARDKRVPEAVVTQQIATWAQALALVESEDFAAVHRLVLPEHAAGAPSIAGRTARLVPASMVRTSPGNEVASSSNTASTSTATTAEPSTGQLRFGLQVSRFNVAGGPREIGEWLGAIARAAEVAGFESIWVMDHFRQIPQAGRAWDDMLESYTTLTYLAAVTKTIRVGTLVTGITYRNVAHLAKIIATLDVLSGGRANCGIGLGWFKQEHEAYGWSFPSVTERYALLEDALQLLPAMWSAGTKPFAGKAIAVPETMCYPRPLQDHIPILVGGSGERRTLRLVAQYADACNLFGEAPQVTQKLTALDRHCDDVGRDPSTIDVTHLSTVLAQPDHTSLATAIERLKPVSVSAERFARSVNAGTTAQHVDRLGNLVDAGVQTEIVSLADLHDTTAVARYGDVITVFRS